jgi:SAM-dependent methyltransferase
LTVPYRPLWQIYAYLYDGLLQVFTYRDMIDQVCKLADCEGRTVLDVGAGTGNVTESLIGLGAARVIAVDFSSNMLGRARRKLVAEIAAGRVDLIQGDALMAMSTLPDASVDRVTAVNFLYALPDRSAFFRQARRILAPGGFIIAAHTTKASSAPIVRDQFHRGGIRACIRPRLIGIAAIDLVIGLLARGGRYDFAPVRTVAREAAAAGLPKTVNLGRCYGGAADGVNELIRISAD